jgi:hypothetical protein
MNNARRGHFNGSPLDGNVGRSSAEIHKLGAAIPLPPTFTNTTQRVCRSTRVAIWLLPLPKAEAPSQ